MRTLALGLAVALLPAPAPQAGPGCATDAMLVFDGSASMGELGYDPTAPTRIAEAREALRRAVPEIAPYRRVGLLTYGPGGDHPCSGISLRFSPMANAAAALVAGIERLDPGGLTPLASSVAAAARALDYRARPGIVVLVTDGNETCGGTPCALSAALAQDARDLTVHVIGFRIVHDPFSWNSPEAGEYDGQTVAKCLADATGGLFVTTETVGELAAALRETLGCPLIGWQDWRAPPRGRG
ncbi:VWA domain-containing protein [uncultured Roseovarius sp.]|uniref:vWA domain-containing protein n=1 Tax=uncultured Roseovarius sp. TaxID=293344 RepID=UPI00263589AB|nr:VWA domain-containing protein [uncultured Roseovarius sp.]